MIPVIEDYLSELVSRKIKQLKENPTLISKILGVSEGRTTRLQSYLGSPDSKIAVVKGFPRPDAVLPCYAVLLAEEEETQDGLGDYDELGDYSVSDATEEITVTEGRNGQLQVQLSKFPLEYIVSIQNNDTGIQLNPSEYDVVDPDKGIIGFFTAGVELDDSVTVTYNYKQTASEGIMTLFNATFRIEAWSANADLTGEMFHLLKWCLLSGRDELGMDKLLIRQKMSGGDLNPMSDYMPTFVYRRGLNFWCQYESSIVSEDVNYITDVDSHMTVVSKIVTNRGEDQ
ncbi:hypothetical protein [Bacillus phage SPO1L1]|nr:hypothetical protein [Bacillus phage SPO1L1]WIT26014.1 hypothetical protein [Bacillus phage SPO1L2]